MTLIVAAIGKNCIWLLADRRVSFKGRAPKDNATKVVSLDCTDGTALLGYTGLGATALGTEPSDWVSKVLRGRSMDVETSLFCIAEAMTIQFPRHISTLPPTHPRLHSFIVPAIINEKMYIYSVDLRRLRNNADYTYEVNQQMLDIQDKVISCPIYAAGSGAVALGHLGNWERPLLRMIQAYDNGKIGGSIVADEFAKLNQCIAKKDKWVGDRCIVAWANSKSGRYQGGGDYQYYTGRNRDLISHGFPSLWTGTDLGALAGIFDAMFDENLRRGIRWPQAMEFDSERIKKRLSELPNRPDEELR